MIVVDIPGPLPMLSDVRYQITVLHLGTDKISGHGHPGR